MRRRWIELVLLSLVCAGGGGCGPAKPAAEPSAQPSGSPVAGPGSQGQSAAVAGPQSQAQAAGTAAAPGAAIRQPHHYARPPIDQDTTAGVRGTQIVDFVVTAAGKAVEGARVTVKDARGKTDGDGRTSDWGEFHAGLEAGSYIVSVEWDGKTLVKPVTVGAGTNRVDLKLDGE